MAGLVVIFATPSRADANAEILRCLAEEKTPSCSSILAETLADPQKVGSLADELIARKDYRRAVNLLDLGVKRHPDEQALRSRLSLARSYEEEQAWMERRGRGEATRPSGEVSVSLARIRCTRLTGEEALAACDEALRFQGGDATLLAAKGDLLAAAGRTTEAVTVYGEALRIKPDDAIVRQKRALLSGAPESPAGGRKGSEEKTPTDESDDLAQRLATLERLRQRKLVDAAEYNRRRQVLLDGFLGTQPVAREPAVQAAPAIDFGRYHALVIGIDNYKHLPRLETARNDARTLAATLTDHYGFQVRMLLDATREQIIEALDEYREKLTAGENLLIYYAGHGWLDKEADQGFWLGVDARADRRGQWLSNDTVRDAAKAMKAKHLLVVADSCFSGTLTRGFTVPSARDIGYLKRMAGKKARQAMSSGGLEPVADSSGDGHSPFAKALVDILVGNTGVIDGTTLFSELRRPVAVNAEQTPEFADIRRAGHDGGDFLFVRRR